MMRQCWKPISRTYMHAAGDSAANPWNVDEPELNRAIQIAVCTPLEGSDDDEMLEDLNTPLSNHTEELIQELEHNIQEALDSYNEFPSPSYSPRSPSYNPASPYYSPYSPSFHNASQDEDLYAPKSPSYNPASPTFYYPSQDDDDLHNTVHWHNGPACRCLEKKNCK